MCFADEFKKLRLDCFRRKWSAMVYEIYGQVIRRKRRGFKLFVQTKTLFEKIQAKALDEDHNKILIKMGA